MTTAEEVTLELTEMKKVGMRVTKKAMAYPAANAAEMDEFRNNGMRISDIADMVCDIADI